MTIKTGGRIRGLIGRWLFRIEAAGGIIRMVSLGVTAASTLTSALVLIGAGWLAPYVLVAGSVGTFAFAYGYVESGVFNRKNRERIDRGDNYIGASGWIAHTVNARIWGAAFAEATDADREQVMDVAEQVAQESMAEFRDGVDPDDAFSPESNGNRSEVNA